ncbi:ABC-type nitrate/sulfonate/bicarbonate transport system substrate-binding protein [Bacillus ectoiniformans]|uniref:ABC transporter substrate-binding protein n=1 Tax=Bacillus ectoiniformans TaxID=1494429 RepID=UPI0019584C94|nr:ABC transporter substrate-binding protein [Bacillus ectoiniformans]MBM7649840.1 ABC-type nitrate/sulfonate/bicarbonate transport system substrate-binding protein [Bacillus ectoiniformans]
MKKWFLLLVAAFLLTGCGGANNDQQSSKEKKLKKVSVVLDWTPNTNHTGLYVAKEKGYFEQQGLDVEILLPGEAGADQLVASGKAQFGVSFQEQIATARTSDLPLVSVAAIVQHNTSGFASPAAKDIKSPKDFEGKTYGGWGSPIEKQMMASLMKAENADINKVKFINIGESDFFTAIKRDIDFAWIYQGWTGVEADLRKEDLNMIYLKDYAKELDYYTPVLATNEKMIDEDPETVKHFVHAASKGYQYAIDNPDQSAEILSSAVPDLDKDLVVKSQRYLSPKYQEDAERWGEQEASRWENFSEWMYENKLIDKELDSKKAYTNEFLPK